MSSSKYLVVFVVGLLVLCSVSYGAVTSSDGTTVVGIGQIGGLTTAGDFILGDFSWARQINPEFIDDSSVLYMKFEEGAYGGDTTVLDLAK